LTRPRLLRSLVGRWNHRVTSLVGGPGLGKTTLLAQAIAENRLAPRGDDVWVGVEPQDSDAERLAAVVADAIDRAVNGGGPDLADGSVPGPGWVADAVWRRAPTEACLVFDDVHLLPEGSTAATWLSDVITALPANGHVVFASRTEPPVPLARFGASGSVLRLAEDDLRFSDDELSGFAARRGLDPERFGETGGWPAMAELAASVDRRFTGTYLWEEVLEPLGMLRRHVLTVLSDLGGADDELASAVFGSRVDLSEMLAGVPLVAQGEDGWHVPHALWRTAPGIALPATERGAVRRAAAAHLSERGRYDEAFTLLQEAELWDEAPAVLRAACLAIDRLDHHQLGRWLASSTEAVRSTPSGSLAIGLHAAFTSPTRATGLLHTAIARNRAAGDVDAELAAIAQLGQIAWQSQDLDALGDAGARVLELEPTGLPQARAMAAIARALLTDLAGDDAGVVAELGGVESGVLGTVWEISASWLSGVARLDLGDIDGVREVTARLAPLADAAMRPMVDSLELRARWRQGRVDEVCARFPAVLAAEEATGLTYNVHLGQVFVSGIFSHTGDAAAARRYLNDAAATTPPSPSGDLSALHAVATASMQLTEGDEKAAVATLRRAIEVHGLDEGQDRRAWRQMLPLSYVLVPETRDHWDGAALRGYLALSRDLAAAVVASREGNATALRAVELPDLGLVRAALHHCLAADLAVGLTSVGRSEARALLDALGAPGRSAVRAITHNRPPQARRARSLLNAVPAPPPRPTYLAMLGPFALRLDGPDGTEVVNAELRRPKVHALLAYLVMHRRTSRGAIIAALWPDLDERAASNNLAVTLNHLLRALEPWRDSGEPAYLIRADGPSVHLVTGDHLRLDVDEFDRHVAAAARTEAEGAPSLALEHHLAAVSLYRGELHLDLPHPDFSLDREHYRSRFVAAAVRAGQLLLSRGDHDQAQVVARRALAVDQWSEDAYAVLVGAALARGNRSAARRLLDHCLAALADLGVAPSEATRQLQRRLQGDDT
jgi:ATP/maltotriose-dependent transcriptional regulator MalT/DNA-binding SARP family transcriptional activator